MKNQLSNGYYDREQRDFHEIKKIIRRAKRIFFLGFGFARENMDILGIPSVLKHKPIVHGTALGWTGKEMEEKRSYIKCNYPALEDVNCYDLLREYL
jgi:hypothetical protein